MTDRLRRLRALAHNLLDGVESADGSIVLRVPDAGGTVRSFSVAAGDRLADGTVYAGLSAALDKPLFAAPADAGLKMSFNEAAAYAGQKNAEGYLGHDDWRVPSEAELRALCAARGQGTFKETFDARSLDFYWSSTQPARQLGIGGHFSKEEFLLMNEGCKGRVRLVRGG